jgi:hypothetical protein
LPCSSRSRPGTTRSRSMPVPPGTLALFGFDSSCRTGLLPIPSKGTFEAEAAKHTFTLRGVNFAGSSADYTGTYTVSGDRLQLAGLREGKPLAPVLTRDSWGPTP